jgi:hypothetical protein
MPVLSRIFFYIFNFKAITMIDNDLKICFQAIEGSKLVELKNSLFVSAVRYARIRTDWHFMNTEDRKQAEDERTRSHNAFIDKCNIMSRNQQTHGEDGSWRQQLGQDRSIIGDFACYIHLWLGLQAR